MVGIGSTRAAVGIAVLLVAAACSSGNGGDTAVGRGGAGGNGGVDQTNMAGSAGLTGDGAGGGGGAAGRIRLNTRSGTSAQTSGAVISPPPTAGVVDVHR